MDLSKCDAALRTVTRNIGPFKPTATGFVCVSTRVASPVTATGTPNLVQNDRLRSHIMSVQ